MVSGHAYPWDVLGDPRFLDRAPRRVTLAMARKGVAMTVTTASATLRAKADKGAKVRVSRRAGGFRLVVKATRKGAYKVTISLPSGVSRVVTLNVR